MAWPPTVPAQRAATDTMAAVHTGDHNKIATALSDLVARFPSSKAWSNAFLPSANVFIDQNIQWSFADGQVFSVPTVQTITVSAATTGWLVGVVPSLAIYSNDVADPWTPGNGMTFAFVVGSAFAAGNVSNGNSNAKPLVLPSVTHSRKIAANAAAPTYFVRIGVHSAPGAISWWGRYDVSITRTLDLT